MPALIPSWRFFDTIAASPRIEYALPKTRDDSAARWQEFRPRPAHLSVLAMLGRLVWNPRWNESLFMVSCAERLMENPAGEDPEDHSHQEILNRLRAELVRGEMEAAATRFVQFRLVFISRQGVDLVKQVTYESPVHPLVENAAP